MYRRIVTPIACALAAAGLAAIGWAAYASAQQLWRGDIAATYSGVPALIGGVVAVFCLPIAAALWGTRKAWEQNDNAERGPDG
ncbi:MAG: hypothetical protein AAF790_09105 [Planctomycetota bacterium]